MASKWWQEVHGVRKRQQHEPGGQMELYDLDIRELSAVDSAAHGHDDFLLMKSLDGMLESLGAPESAEPLSRRAFAWGRALAAGHASRVTFEI